jgi:hypothetical protein
MAGAVTAVFNRISRWPLPVLIAACVVLSVLLVLLGITLLGAIVGPGPY